MRQRARSCFFSELTRGGGIAASNIVLQFQVERLQNELEGMKEQRRRDRHNLLRFHAAVHMRKKLEDLLIVSP